MLINLFEDVDHFALVGGKKAVRRLAVSMAGSSSTTSFLKHAEEQIMSHITLVKRVNSERAQAALSTYIKFWIAGITLDVTKMFVRAPDPPWSQEQYHSYVDSVRTNIGITLEIAQNIVQVHQDTYALLSKLPAGYPDQGLHPTKIAFNIATRQNGWTPINTTISTISHYLGTDGQPGIQVPEILTYRISADAFPAHLDQLFGTMETKWRMASEEKRAELAAAMASGDVIVVDARSDVSTSLIAETEFSGTPPTEIMGFDTPKNGRIAWFNLHTDNCQVEARVLDHCGSGGSDDSGAVLVSLRERRKVLIRDEGVLEDFWEPKVTASANPQTGVVYELRGRGNTKPKAEYHPYIISMIDKGIFKEFVEPDYRPEHTFELKDLPHSELLRLLEKHHSLVPVYDLLTKPEYMEDGKPRSWVYPTIAEQLKRKSSPVREASSTDGKNIDVTLRYTFHDYLRKLDGVDFIRSGDEEDDNGVSTGFSSLRWMLTDSSFVSYDMPEVSEAFVECVLGDELNNFNFDYGPSGSRIKEIVECASKYSQHAPHTSYGVRFGMTLSNMLTTEEGREPSRAWNLPFEISVSDRRDIRALFREFRNRITQRAVFGDFGTVQWFNKALVTDIAQMIQKAQPIGYVTNSEDASLTDPVELSMSVIRAKHTKESRYSAAVYRTGIVECLVASLTTIDPRAGYDFNISEAGFPTAVNIFAQHWEGKGTEIEPMGQIDLEDYYNKQFARLVKKYLRTASSEDFYNIMNEAIASVLSRPGASG